MRTAHSWCLCSLFLLSSSPSPFPSSPPPSWQVLSGPVAHLGVPHSPHPGERGREGGSESVYLHVVIIVERKVLVVNEMLYCTIVVASGWCTLKHLRHVAFSLPQRCCPSPLNPTVSNPQLLPDSSLACSSPHLFPCMLSVVFLYGPRCNDVSHSTFLSGKGEHRLKSWILECPRVGQRSSLAAKGIHHCPTDAVARQHSTLQCSNH